MSSSIEHPRLVVGIDGSAASNAAVDCAARDAAMRDEFLALVHIATGDDRKPGLIPLRRLPGNQPVVVENRNRGGTFEASAPHPVRRRGQQNVRRRGRDTRGGMPQGGVGTVRQAEKR